VLDGLGGDTATALVGALHRIASVTPTSTRRMTPEAGCFPYRPSIDRLFWLGTGGADRSRPLTGHPIHDRGSSASEGLLGGPLSRGRTGRAQRHRESMSGLNYRRRIFAYPQPCLSWAPDTR
jgi:hypothetical protein